MHVCRTYHSPLCRQCVPRYRDIAVAGLLQRLNQQSYQLLPSHPSLPFLPPPPVPIFPVLFLPHSHRRKPRVEGQSHREPVGHASVVAQPPASNLSLSQKPDSVQDSDFTARARQVVTSAKASGSGQAPAEVQGIGSPQGPTYGVDYSCWRSSVGIFV